MRQLALTKEVITEPLLGNYYPVRTSIHQWPSPVYTPQTGADTGYTAEQSTNQTGCHYSQWPFEQIFDTVLPTE